MTLKAQFKHAWNAVGAKKRADETFDFLVAQYSQGHRAYHNIGHVKHVLQEFSHARKLANNPNLVRLALWFHDVCYTVDPQHYPTNESASAAVASNKLFHAGAPQNVGSQVSDLVMATKPGSEPTLTDQKLVVDCDLSILGQHPEAYDMYEQAIRKEFLSVVPNNDDWKVLRKRFLEGFLKKPYLFNTTSFRDKYEPEARDNIERTIEKLRI